MSTKSHQLQIRVTAAQKAALQARAKEAGSDLSAYVLDRALPWRAEQFRDLLHAMAVGDQRFALAEVNDLLAACPPEAFAGSVQDASVGHLEPYLQNYLAGMVEQAAHQKQVPPPAWAARVAPLREPHFATPMRSLRLHLLRSAPVPFKRRNLFVDSAVGARV